MAKHNIQINDSELYSRIVGYCKINGLKIGSFVTEMLRKQFMVEQYGDVPFGGITLVGVKTDDPKPMEAVLVNYDLAEVTETITNGPIKEQYMSKEVPKEFYGEIKTESSTVTVQPPQTEGEIKKPKKRRL